MTHILTALPPSLTLCPVSRLVQGHEIKTYLFSVLHSLTDGLGTLCKYFLAPSFQTRRVCLCLSVCLSVSQPLNTAELQFRATCS